MSRSCPDDRLGGCTVLCLSAVTSALSYDAGLQFCFLQLLSGWHGRVTRAGGVWQPSSMLAHMIAGS